MTGILEEIDDELDLYCSSQDTTDSENEQIDFDMSVESETAPTNGKEYKRKAGGEKHSGCRTKSPKYTSEPKGDCEHTRYLVHVTVFLLIVSVVSLTSVQILCQQLT